MQLVPQICKDKPIASIATLTTLVAIFSGVFLFEDRYVHAAQFNKYMEQQQKTLETLQTQQQKGLDTLYRQITEDELFALELKRSGGKASAIDEARIEHLKRRLQQHD